MTPMMQQYFEIKKNYADCILMYRLGDFYEMFFDDAKTASRELELTLTGRDCGEEERAPMCGVPFHSVEPYIAKLISRGYKVAICEQMEDPAEAKGLVKRDILRVITPGTVTQSDMLDASQNNYVAAVYYDTTSAAVCFADVSTGYISASCAGADFLQFITNETGTYSPREIMTNFYSGDCPTLDELFRKRLKSTVNYGEAGRFERDGALSLCRAQFSDIDFDSVDGGIIRCVGAVLGYIIETQKADISYINNLQLYNNGQFLQMDINTRRNLELCEVMRGGKKGSLLWVLDHTKTAGGARLLRKWVEEPLISVNGIIRRQSAVAELTGDFMMREELAQSLSGVLDMERLATKIIYGTATPKDLRAVAQTIQCIPAVMNVISSASSELLSEICSGIDALEDINSLICSAITDEPPFSTREGGIIRDGYDRDIDYLRGIMKDGRLWIAKIEENERIATGIKNLRVSYNKVFGYYIEISKSNISDVPKRYIRKQTLTNCERYITEELKEFESSIIGASDKIVKLEYEIFCRVRDFLCENIARIRDTATRLSSLDALMSLAVCAVKNKYVRPEVDLSDIVSIKDGRHPVVELFVRDGGFVPNDTELDTAHNRLMLITGPNMAGKSTYMRQTALIVVMAQIGSFVPAAEARVGICDKVFTRVGASDDLASGQSTFMLEMNEVAYILKHATRRSLIIYDEIGRGTSTFDGMSIARATAEYTAGKKLGAKTLFATHYHELTELEGQVEGVVNYNIAAKKKGDDILFLRKIVRGATDDSYGIEVAKLAGVPSSVIKRAREILSVIEENTPERSKYREAESLEDLNISLESVAADEIREKLKNTDINILTPIEAFDILRELKKMV